MFRCARRLLLVSALNGAVPPALFRPAYNTSNLIQLLQKALPSTANMLIIDNTGGSVESNNAASILRFLISHDQEVGKLQENPEFHHPLLVLVQTSLEKDDAEANELVLTAALQLRERFKGTTAIVLNAEQSAAAKSVLQKQKGNGMIVKIGENAGKSPAEEKEKEKEKEISKANDIAASSHSKHEEEKMKKRKSTPPSRQSRRKKVQDGNNGDVSTSLSYVPPPGAVRTRTSPTPLSLSETRESLQRMFRSSLAAPFKMPSQVERTLFAGFVDRVRFADLLNLPLYGGGEVFVLYYRLTGAGACRTPLITITHAIKEACTQRVSSSEMDNGETEETVKGPVPVLLLLSAPFLIGDDASLLRQEYQKSLQSNLLEVADVTVLMAPHCFSEKNILFALRTTEVSNRHRTDEVQETEAESTFPFPGRLRSYYKEEEEEKKKVVHNTVNEETLRSIVTSALEEVALRHEKSTDHLVSTLNKLVEYWSRERVIELMESLQNEREVLLDATKEFADVQRQLSGTNEVLKELKSGVQSIEKEVKHSNNGAGVDNVAFTKSVGLFEKRLNESISSMPTKEQMSLDLREELEDLRKNLQRDLDQSLTQRLFSLRKEQQKDLEQTLQKSKGANSSEEEVMGRVLQELPNRIQHAMENALQVFTKHSDERTLLVLNKQQEIVNSQVTALCGKMCEKVEKGRRNFERSVMNLLKKKLEHGGIGINTNRGNRRK
ncbi:hypothetical protein LSM04_006659 [Trypanosoma melophagium]|uniref:uncharacterized protein n=1 Tax=Trypanosoma melophagium TaxID=715481 RepID=UPI00351A3256|nr:hypothetical protein LSM04_006659 [Trypanosoma melophagium]